MFDIAKRAAKKKEVRLNSDRLLNVDRNFCQGFDTSIVLAQGIFNHTIVEALNHDLAPLISDAS